MEEEEREVEEELDEAKEKIDGGEKRIEKDDGEELVEEKRWRKIE